MWQYTNQNELYHYGILGMKWGVRRYQNKDGSLTNAGKQRYTPQKNDEILYGKKGAQRIADRRNKGDSRRKAEAKEVARGMAKVAALSIGTTAALYLYGKSNMYRVVNAGKRAVDDVVGSYFNTSIIDSNGKVIKRYHEAVNVGKKVVTDLVKR